MNELSQNLVRFLLEYIHSVEQLEVLLLLRDQKEREWTAQEVNDTICSDVDSIKRRLRQLQDIELVAVTQSDCFRYADQSLENELIVEELASAYRERRTRIIELIYSKSKRDLYNFSNAFVVIKKDQKDG